MAAINRAALARHLEPGLNVIFGNEYNQYSEEWKEVFEVSNSKRAFEEDQMVSGFGLASEKNEGTAVSFDDAQEVWTSRYDMVTYGLGFIITEEAIDDNLYDDLSSRYTKALARSMRHTKETIAANVLNNGFSASYAGGDGKELFATDHPLLSGGVLSNEPTTPADLSETALEDACIQIAAWTDERGLLVTVMPEKVIVPRQLAFVAERIMQSTGRVGTADNDINALRSKSAIPGGYTVNHFLTDPDAFFIKTDAPNGMRHFQRKKMTTSMDEVFDTNSLKYKAVERYAFGWSDPRGMWGSPGA